MPFALTSMFLAAGGWPRPMDFLLIVLAMITARNTGMAFNRLADRKLDAENPRTKDREIPSGALSAKYVTAFVALNALGFVLICYLINPLVFKLSFLTLGILYFYSYTKRFTWLCHAVLGLGLGISPIGAWLVVTGEFAKTPVYLGIMVLFWVSGFDAIYSLLDREHDVKSGIHSIASKFGRRGALMWAAFFHGCMLFFFYLFLLATPWGKELYLFLGVMVAVLLYEHVLAWSSDIFKVNKAFFQANIVISLMVLSITCWEIFLN